MSNEQAQQIVESVYEWFEKVGYQHDGVYIVNGRAYVMTSQGKKYMPEELSALYLSL